MLWLSPCISDPIQGVPQELGCAHYTNNNIGAWFGVLDILAVGDI